MLTFYYYFILSLFIHYMRIIPYFVSELPQADVQIVRCTKVH